MSNEIYIANQLADTMARLPEDEKKQVASMIDSLEGDGWKNSEIVLADKSGGGGMRAAFHGYLSLIFRYVPEQHAIIVTDVKGIADRQAAATV